MLLIFPPIAKASEPPAGIARLAGYLKFGGANCRVLDANLEGQLWLLQQPVSAMDTWSRRAVKGRDVNLAALRNHNVYQAADRYRRSVGDINRALAVAASSHGVTLGLADFRHDCLSPVRSEDLIFSARHYEKNPFFLYFSRRLPELLNGVGAIGFSLNYLSQAITVFAMIGYVRENYPGIATIVGGGLVTSWMQRPGWRNPFGQLIDHLVSGPGEMPLLAILGRSETAGQHVTPDYSGLPLREYLSPGLVLPYSAGSGCYWNRCSFCPERAEGRSYSPVAISDALSDLKQQIIQTDPVLVHLLDNAVSPALLRALADNSPGVPWYGFARIGGDLIDPLFCRALRRSGCVMLKLGLESGDQGVLDMMQKGIDLGSASQVLNNLKDAGIAVYCYLLFGTPGETLGAAERTLEFVVRHSQAIDFLNLAIFNMPLYGDDAAKYGNRLFYEGDLSLYTAFRHPAGWNRRDVRRFLNNEFKRHPDIAAIIRKDPPFFSSNHAAFHCRIQQISP